MKQIIFNSFKEDLLKGKITSAFNYKCYALNQQFFDTYQNSEVKIENYRNLTDFNDKLSLESVLPSYKKTNIRAWYGLEFLTIPQTTSVTAKTMDDKIQTISYSTTNNFYYTSAQMSYHYEEVASGDVINGTNPIFVGDMFYSAGDFLINQANEMDPPYQIDESRKADGSNLHFGIVPEKQSMISNLAENGSFEFEAVNCDDFRGFLFTDEYDNNITYIDTENPIQLKSGAFVYNLAKTTTINNKKYGIFFGVEWE